MTKLNSKQRAALRQLAGEAWERELTEALEALFETFCKWADKGMSAFELTDRIHAFHHGVARELYKHYTGVKPDTAVAVAIARGVLDEAVLDGELRGKLEPLIEAFRERTDR